MKWVLLWIELQTNATSFYGAPQVHPELFPSQTSCKQFAESKQRYYNDKYGSVVFGFTCHMVNTQ